MMDLPQPEDVFIYHPGQIPILLSVPHGVSEPRSSKKFLQKRSAGRTLEELYILELADELSGALTRLWSAPHVFIANIHRSRIDFARGKDHWRGERAYDDPRAETCYDLFEHHLAAICTALVRANPCVFLLDLHGCLTDEFDAYLGTLNGKTVSHSGLEVNPRDTIQQTLARLHWRVAPAPGQMETRFSGRADSIIARHNLAKFPGRHASLQIEISGAIRSEPARRARFAGDLAAALLATLQIPT